MIEKGKKAPAFSLKNQNGGTVSLADYVGKKVILYFYPKDDTPGCTSEGLEFSALKEEFEKHNTVIFGISRDTVDSHKKFHEKYGFTIDLLSNESGEVLEEYDALRERDGGGTGIARSTVFIDEEGVVHNHWRTVEAKGHAQAVLAYIKENN